MKTDTLDQLLATESRAIFFYLLSACVLEQDMETVAAHKLARPLHRVRSDAIDQLAGLDFHAAKQTTTDCAGHEPVRDLVKNMTPECLIRYAFYQGYLELAAQGLGYLDQVGPFQPSDSQAG